MCFINFNSKFISDILNLLTIKKQGIHVYNYKEKKYPYDYFVVSSLIIAQVLKTETVLIVMFSTVLTFYGPKGHPYDCFPMGSNYILYMYIYIFKEVVSFRGPRSINGCGT